MGFTLWGHPYDLCLDEYNCRGETERAVEIPVAKRWLSQQRGDGVEIGNVLSHYQPVSHRVIDRYEVAEGVDNLDVFELRDPVDWILAISTIEHVRWDYPEWREPGRSFEALLHLRGLLNPGGRMLVTIPWGCNPPLDEMLTTIPREWLRASAFLIRQPGGPQDWREGAEPRAYGGDTAWADTVWIGEFRA